MNRQQMIKTVESLTSLPTLPMVAMEMNRMLQDIETPIERLVAVLERDQTMVVKILRLVNSSFFGFRNQVTTLRHAVTLLGYGTMQNAVVTVSVIDSLKLENELKGFDISDFWSHAIGVAVMCRHLANQTRIATAEEAFTAGLVHDIGKVVLINIFPDLFKRIMEGVNGGNKPFFAVEQQLGSWPHSRIGAHLARRWMLPEILGKSVQYHHSTTGAAESLPVANLVRMADTLVNLMEGRKGYRLDTETLPPAIKAPMTAVLKNSADWFPAVKEEMSAATDFFKQG
ncbi:HD family phosphohydrolase [Desulfosarcina ovata subsp. sediminis]|uniref:HD family phosphohydrolase n=1 Tax=Desulfosarcina ovata subsp. sediminis TaxID=885957 RepID=A0A5K7ZR80_9BACT|nr:HDOD domain-containing protein [Desulfosarcina ovata]BBO82910.1 HD family phosphohydrolase [Desulfosarcina ovata subsp. sediminis]